MKSMPIKMRILYQQIYEKKEHQEWVEKRSPGIRHYPLYKHWLKGKIFDWGCGTGATVRFLRKHEFEVDGMDWIDLKNGMKVGDITMPHCIFSDTALCIDVIEHIIDHNKVFQNLTQSNRQVINISNMPSIVDGVELHINKRSFVEWTVIIEEFFFICDIIESREHNMLYLCENKNVR